MVRPLPLCMLAATGNLLSLNLYMICADCSRPPYGMHSSCRSQVSQSCREQVDTTKMPFAAIGMIRLQGANDSGAEFCSGTLISQVRDLAPDMRLHFASVSDAGCACVVRLLSL